MNMVEDLAIPLMGHFIVLCLIRSFEEQRLFFSLSLFYNKLHYEHYRLSLLKIRGIYLCVFNFLFNLLQPCLVFLKLYLFSLRKARYDNRAVVTVVTFTVPRQSHSSLSISCAVCLRSVCLLLMDVFLDIFPSARDADEREKWIHALEGTILRHTLQQVRATSRPHVPWLHLSQVKNLLYNMLRPHSIFGGCFVTFIPCLFILSALGCTPKICKVKVYYYFMYCSIVFLMRVCEILAFLKNLKTTKKACKRFWG